MVSIKLVAQRKTNFLVTIGMDSTELQDFHNCEIVWFQLCYVMPSSSARCAQFPRAQDKVHYYIKLKDLRDQLKGIERNTDVQEVQYTFDLQLAQGESPASLLVLISCVCTYCRKSVVIYSRRRESSYICSRGALIMGISHR